MAGTVKAGGAKGVAILALMAKEPGLTRAQLAEKVGSTGVRVGEVVRWLAASGTPEEQAVVAAHLAAQPVRRATAAPEVEVVKVTPTSKAKAKAKATPARPTKVDVAR